jgi:hypothetical protein
MIHLEGFSPKYKHITSKDQEHPNMTIQGHTMNMNVQTLILIVGGFFILTFSFPISSSSVDIGDDHLKPSTSQFHV